MTLSMLDATVSVAEFNAWRQYDAAVGLPDALAARQRAVALAMFHRSNARGSNAEAADYVPAAWREGPLAVEDLMDVLESVVRGTN